MVCERWRVTKMVCDKVEGQRWCVTKLCVKDGVSTMVGDKVVCERWCVTKLCERWCVTKMVCERRCFKDGV